MGKLSEIAFFTDDVASMSAFYEQFLGEKPVAESDGMAIFMMEETKLFIHRTYEWKEGELPPENHMAYGVADVDAAALALEARGLSLEIPPEDYYWGRSAYLRDPDGHLWELTQAQG